jgi:hypothetical protein
LRLNRWLMTHHGDCSQVLLMTGSSPTGSAFGQHAGKT